ncbi:MAG: hypothetical protein PHP85_09720 [Gallionella sp.]|nr:hypothetical protein [Gallionella sp.]
MNDEHISVEQQRYANWLSRGARSGLLILIVSFLSYVFGLIPAHIPLEQLPAVWNLPAGEYLKLTGSPTGWGWLRMLGFGDFASLLGIAWLSGCSLLCLAVVMPVYAGRKDWVFVGLCVVALLVQILAASGILTVGH